MDRKWLPHDGPQSGFFDKHDGPIFGQFVVIPSKYRPLMFIRASDNVVAD